MPGCDPSLKRCGVRRESVKGRIVDISCRSTTDPIYEIAV